MGPSINRFGSLPPLTSMMCRKSCAIYDVLHIPCIGGAGVGATPATPHKKSGDLFFRSGAYCRLSAYALNHETRGKKPHLGVGVMGIPLVVLAHPAGLRD